MSFISALIAALLYGNIGIKVFYSAVLRDVFRLPPLNHKYGKLLWVALGKLSSPSKITLEVDDVDSSFALLQSAANSVQSQSTGLSRGSSQLLSRKLVTLPPSLAQLASCSSLTLSHQSY